MTPSPKRAFVVSQSAAFELNAAFHWYEGRKVGLGHEYLASAETLFAQIAAGPESFRRVKGETRRGLLTRFPYGVFFVADGSRVVVLAVLHVRVAMERWPSR